MGSFSIVHWLVVLAVVLLLFGGRGKISAIMGDFGKGLRNFKTGLKGPEDDTDDEVEVIEEVVKAKPKSPKRKTAAKKKSPSKKTAQK